MDKERIGKLIKFLKEIEKFKLIERISYVSNKVRYENDAEHTWHLAMILLTLEKELDIEFDTLKTLKIILIHDLAEIYCGDIFTTNESEQLLKVEKERISINKLFSLLPQDLELEFRNLWFEYEENITIEAKIAKALDKLQYLLQYSCSGIIDDKYFLPIEESKNYASKYTDFNQLLSYILDLLIEEMNIIRKVNC